MFCWRTSALSTGSMYGSKGQANHRNPPHNTGPSTKPGKRGWRPLRFRLACGTRSAGLVDNHHRAAERHTPQPARVSLAERRGFLEVALSKLWWNLCIRGRCAAKQYEKEQRVERVSSLHRHLFRPKA